MAEVASTPIKKKKPRGHGMLNMTRWGPHVGGKIQPFTPPPKSGTHLRTHVSLHEDRQTHNPKEMQNPKAHLKFRFWN